MMNYSLFLIILIFLSLINNSNSLNGLHFHTETRSTQLVNRTLFGTITECSIRLGGKQFQLKFYKIITCRYVQNLSIIYPYLLKYSNDITALEIMDSKLEDLNLNSLSKVLREFEFLIFHRMKIINQTTICPFNLISTKLFYLHLTDFSPSLDRLFSRKSCLIMKRLHVLILDNTNLGNENLLLNQFPNIHLLRLNFSSFNHPLNSSYLRLFPYLQDLFLNVHDDCHRCEYEWIKYAIRDNNYQLFRISPKSGCMDWNRNQKFLQWQYAPLCGTCSLPIIINKIRTNQYCKMEDGITEHYCKAFYGQESLFQSWINITENIGSKYVGLPSTMSPTQYFMKSKYTKRYKRDIMNNNTFSTTIQPQLLTNNSTVTTKQLPKINLTTSSRSTLSPWQSRLIVTRNPTNLFNRSYCKPIIDSPYRPKIRLNLPSLIDQLRNLSQVYSPNCSNIQCDIIQSDYLGPVCLKTGITYANICEILYALCTKQLDTYDFEIDYFGSCVNNCSLVKRCYSDNEICLMTPKPHCISRQKNCTGYSPVCDTYSKTFVNQCHLFNSLKYYQPRQIAYHGPCLLNHQCTKNLCQTNEICLQTQDKYHYPVCINCHLNQTDNNCPFELFCGDNNRQYINRCQLYHERCQTKKFIQIKYFGLCHEED